MANTLTPSIEELWSRRQQVVHHRYPIFQALANTEERETLKKGDTVHRTYRSQIVSNTMGSEGQYTRQDIADTDETLVVDTEKDASFYIKKMDEIQTKYHTLSAKGNGYADDAAKVLYNKIDSTFVKNMADNAGTTLSAVTLSTSNVYSNITSAHRTIVEQTNDPRPSNLFAAISPRYYQQLLLTVGGNRATSKGDMVLMNGKVNELFDFDIYVTMALPCTSVLALATQPTANDTVTYMGVTFTFVASPSAAGDVDLGADVDATRANLAAAINGGSGAGTTYIEISAADRKKFKQRDVVATNDNSANTLTVVATGDVTVGETLTNGTDTWSSNIQHNVFGVKKATDIVIQKSPNVEVLPRDGYVGRDFVSWTAFGVKTFDEGTRMLVSAPLNMEISTP